MNFIFCCYCGVNSTPAVAGLSRFICATCTASGQLPFVAPPPGCPEAYGGCTCECHTTPGIMHFKACCQPEVEAHPVEDAFQPDMTVPAGQVIPTDLAALQAENAKLRRQLYKINQRTRARRDGRPGI